MKTLFSLIEINIALGLLSVLGLVVTQEPKLGITGQLFNLSTASNYSASSSAQPQNSSASPPQIQAKPDSSEVQTPKILPSNNQSQDVEKLAQINAEKSAIILQNQATIQGYAEKIKYLETELAQKQTAKPKATQAMKPVASKSVANRRSPVPQRQIVSQLNPVSVKTTSKKTVAKSTATRTTPRVPTVVASTSSKAIKPSTQPKVLTNSTNRVVTIRPIASSSKSSVAASSRSNPQTGSSTRNLASSKPNIQRTSTKIVRNQGNNQSTTRTATVQRQNNNLFEGKKTQTTRQASTNSNSNSTTGIVTTPKRVFISAKENDKGELQQEPRMVAASVPPSVCACSEIVLEDSQLPKSVEIAKVTSPSVSSADNYLSDSNQSIYQANNLAYGLVVANNKGQIKYGTQMYRKVQTAIKLLRRGESLETAAQKANVPLSIIAQLQQWGESRPGSILAER